MHARKHIVEIEANKFNVENIFVTLLILTEAKQSVWKRGAIERGRIASFDRNHEEVEVRWMHGSAKSQLLMDSTGLIDPRLTLSNPIVV